MKRMTTETNTKSPENRTTKPNYALRRLAALGLIGAMGVVGGTGIVHATSGKGVPKTPSEIAMEFGGYVDKDITSVSIAEGARLRSTPAVSDELGGAPTNLLDTADETIEIKTDDDVIVSSDTDGNWYGIPTESLKRVDPDLHIKGDYVYVNSQRATPHETSSVDIVNQ